MPPANQPETPDATTDGDRCADPAPGEIWSRGRGMHPTPPWPAPFAAPKAAGCPPRRPPRCPIPTSPKRGAAMRPGHLRYAYAARSKSISSVISFNSNQRRQSYQPNPANVNRPPPRPSFRIPTPLTKNGPSQRGAACAGKLPGRRITGTMPYAPTAHSCRRSALGWSNVRRRDSSECRSCRQGRVRRLRKARHRC